MASHRELRILRFTIAFAAAFLAGRAKAQCLNSNCNGVDIPYPFGIRSGNSCSLPDFEIDCDSRPFYRDVELLSIDVQLGQARVRNPISSSCYNTTSKQMDSTTWQLNMSGSPFMFSDSNKLTVVGCRSLAYITNQNDVMVSQYTSGCMSSCEDDKLTSTSNGACNGIGCCQTTIPNGRQFYQVYFDGSMNTSTIYNQTPCSYAVLMESAIFTFSTTYLTLPLEFKNSYGGQAPMVLDWAIRTANSCKEAQKNLTSYACNADNSVCHNSTNGPGYICKCKEGYQGNAYLHSPNGCQDIDECEDSNKYGCYGNCINTLGSFDCFCPAGTRGNASIGPCQKETPLATGIAIGLGVGIGILLLILSVIFLIRKQHSERQKQLRKEYFRKNKGLLLEQLISSDESATDSTKIFTLEELKVATNNFDPARVVGSGGHGIVYKGILSDQRVAAIKKPNTIKEEEINQFINEVSILSQINHRNIVKLFGCCLETEVPLLVYDFIPNGSLNRIIHDDSSNREFSLSWDDSLRIARDVAGALCYLHSAASVSVLHRDVKSSNILLDANYTAKVSDFGASRFIPIDQTHVSTNIQGTFGYLDPEYYHTGHLNEKSDVYSFGVVLLELLLRKKPVFESECGLKKNLSIYFLSEIAGRSIKEIVAPEVLEEATEDEIKNVASIAQACLRLRGEKRPNMKQVEMSLQSIRNKGLRSGSVAPDINHEMHPQRPSGIDINDLANLASASCYRLEQEFMLTASLAR